MTPSDKTSSQLLRFCELKTLSVSTEAKAREHYFSGVLFIKLYRYTTRVDFESVDEILKFHIFLYFPRVLFIMLNKVVLIFNTLKCYSYFLQYSWYFRLLKIVWNFLN